MCERAQRGGCDAEYPGMVSLVSDSVLLHGSEWECELGNEADGS